MLQLPPGLGGVGPDRCARSRIAFRDECVSTKVTALRIIPAG